MEEKDFKRIMIVVMIIVLALLSLLIIKPLFTPIILGLLAAYIFHPLFIRLQSKIKSKNICAFIFVLVVLILFIAVVLSSIQSLSKQLVDLYTSIKSTDFSKIILQSFPSLSNSQETTTSLLAAVSYITSSSSAIILNIATNLIKGIPHAMISFVIFIFTFFFALREGENFRKYISVLFPFPEEYRDKFIKKFDHVINSVIYGQIVVGIAQGIIAGVGYFIFGINNALLFTILTMIVGVIPVIGPWLVWIPLDIILFIRGDITQSIQLLIYGLFVINMIDLIMRPQIVSVKTKMNSAILLIGMIGGTYAFGVIGFLAGPLLLSALILLVEIYKNKKSSESIVVIKEPEKQKIP